MFVMVSGARDGPTATIGVGDGASLLATNPSASRTGSATSVAGGSAGTLTAFPVATFTDTRDAASTVWKPSLDANDRSFATGPEAAGVIDTAALFVGVPTAVGLAAREDVI